MFNKIKAVIRTILFLNDSKPDYQLSENEKIEFEFFLDHTNIRGTIEWYRLDLYDIEKAHELQLRALKAWKSAKLDDHIYCELSDSILIKGTGSVVSRGEYTRHIDNMVVVGKTVLNTVVLRKHFE